ncbi:probable alpha-mannosidase At5g13980 [Carica papaya]|uniref:probable alpha-mannosidase At5g13980 n=1 Tax=Carica papaya TaxID=3649 RepID=UPI000B8CA5DC|nr:probable alpha-mannosidase At5g13980 [Carica papaya]
MHMVVLVYNSLGWPREDVIRVPVIDEHVIVKDSEDKEIESQLVPILNASVSLRDFYATAYLGKPPSVTPKYWLAFSASTPPLGFNTYVISNAKRAAANLKSRVAYKAEICGNDIIEVGPGNLKLLFSAKERKLIQYVNSRTMVKESLEQYYTYYSGNDGSFDLQASGAYIFRPNLTYSINSEVCSHFCISQLKFSYYMFMLTKSYSYFQVGPIPIDDGLGKEVVTQIKTNIQSNKTFFTDSNGRDFIERIRNYRKDWNLEVNEPVAGNYYPINHGIYLKDDRTELSVLVDRSMGGSSIVDGQLELMLHRRLLHDDSRGVAEALNETVCVSTKCAGLTILGKYYLRVDRLGEGSKWRRSFGQQIYSPFLLAFTEQNRDSWKNSRVLKFSGMDPSYVLPDNVAMITLQELDDGKILLRLAHLYEIGEDKDLSVMARVELKKIFPNKKIRKIVETSLSANQERAEMEKKRLVWQVEGSLGEEPKVVRGGAVDPANLVVELAPMEIRTFVIEI